MHEIILILLCVGIGAIPTGIFVKHAIPDIPKINEPVFTRTARKAPEVLDANAELDMKMFNELSSDIQEIIMKYI